MTKAKIHRPMRYVAYFCSALLLATLTACSEREARQNMQAAIKKLEVEKKQPELALPPAQPLPPEKKAKHSKVSAEPVPAFTQQELADYLRGKLLAASPSDGINDNLEVKFDPFHSTLTVIQPTGRCDLFLGALDTNNLSWDIFDPSGGSNPGRDLLRLSATSVSGKPARACFDEKGRPERGISTNRVRLLFSLAKAESVPGFQDKIMKTVKKLIILAGGVEGKELFPEQHGKAKSGGK
jgi:hypothetical protein